MEELHMVENENNEFVGTKEAAKMLGIARDTVSKYCREKKLDAEQDGEGSPWRIRVSSIEEYKRKRGK